MLQPIHFLHIIVMSSMMAFFALPAAAAADDNYASALSQEASGNPMVSVSRRMASSGRGGLIGREDPAEVKAARLGIITPYGKNALVQELRAYYPASYHHFRGLDRGKVQVLVDEFEDNGDVIKVLSLMDAMGQD